MLLQPHSSARIPTDTLMKTRSFHLALALLTCAAASAQGPGGQQDRRPPPIPPMLALFDTDHDGVLSADEIQTAADALGQLDQNGDGQITRDEMRPPRPEGDDQPPALDEPGKPPQGKRPPPPLIAALDADKDGTISAEELEAAPESLKELDKNGDGELSPEEFLHGPPPPREGERNEDRRPHGPPPADEGADTE